MWPIVTAMTAAAVCAEIVSDAGRASGRPDPDWNLEGEIIEASVESATVRLLVEVIPERSGEGERVGLIVPAQATITVQKTDGTIEPGDAADLRVGARIRAQHAGAQFRSLPPQYHASHVRVMRGS